MTQLAPQEPNVARELRRIPEFENLSEESIQALARSLDAKNVRSRTALVDQGVAAPGVLIVLRGALKSVRRTEADERSPSAKKRHHGDFVLLDVLRAPCLHLDSSILDGGHAPASIITLRASLVAVMDWSELRKILANESAFNEKILTHLAGRERALVRRVDELALGPVDERVVHLLDHLARDFGTPVGGGRFIALPLRRQDLAAMVNATTETVSRLLARLEREGKARTTRDGIWWSGAQQKLSAPGSTPAPPASTTSPTSAATANGGAEGGGVTRAS